MRPKISLVLGGAACGKRERALESLCSGSGDVLLVLPSEAFAESVSREVAARMNISQEDARARVVSFTDLVALISRADREERRTATGRVFQRLVITDMLRSVIRLDDFLGPMLDAPGFAAALIERLHEWKAAGATPESLFAASQEAKSRQSYGLSRKLDEFGRILAAYNSFLSDNGLRDEEDTLSRAADRHPAQLAVQTIGVRQIVFHGFFRFNRAQRNLIETLCTVGTPGETIRVVITLDYEEDRALLFAAPGRTLAQLRDRFDTNEIVLKNQQADQSPLDVLEKALFAESATFSTALPIRNRSADVIRIFDAPNPYVEVEMVARAFRRLHDSQGYDWSDFAIILRTTGDYAPILSAIFERYAIPIGVDGPERLSENPLLKTILMAMDVIRHGWQREHVLGFLNSSYVGCDRLLVEHLRKMALNTGVRSSRNDWLALASDQAQPPADADCRTRTPREALRLLVDIAGGWSDTTASVDDFTSLLDQMTKAFGLDVRVDLGDRTRRDRDRAALQDGFAALRSLARLHRLKEVGPMRFDQFHDAVLNCWQNGTAFPSATSDAVRVTEPYDARERHTKFAAVMGLTERVFPRRITEDPFLRDEERRSLRENGFFDLDEQRSRADDERFLFYLAVTTPRQGLILSFPRTAHDSDTLPSFFLDEVRSALARPGVANGADMGAPADSEERSADEDRPALFSVIRRSLADVAPGMDESVNAADRFVAACAGLFDPIGPDQSSQALSAARYLTSQQELVGGSVFASVLQSRHLPALPSVSDGELRTRFARHKAVYTAQELETHALCPFQYLMRHVWEIRPETERLDAGRQATLIRFLLRRFFRTRAKTRSAPLGEEEIEQATETLHLMLDETLQNPKLGLSHYHAAILRQRLAEDLNGFIGRELRSARQFGLTPAHFHVTYGLSGGSVPGDRLSSADPLVITSEDRSEAVPIGGAIDRIDIDPGGKYALALDYVFGHPPQFSAIQRGESLKMTLHVLAMERIFNLRAGVVCYDSMRERGRRRFFRTEHVNIRQFGPAVEFEDPGGVKPLSREQFQEILQTAQARVLSIARSIAAAEVPATPGKHCRQCSYQDVCRTTVGAGHDGERRAGS